MLTKLLGPIVGGIIGLIFFGSIGFFLSFLIFGHWGPWIFLGSIAIFFYFLVKESREKARLQREAEERRAQEVRADINSRAQQLQHEWVIDEITGFDK